MAQLLDERDLGVLTSSMSLLVALVANNHDTYWICLPKCVKILERLSRNNDVPQEYTYYGIPSPWLQVRFPLLMLFLLFCGQKLIHVRLASPWPLLTRSSLLNDQIQRVRDRNLDSFIKEI